MSQVSQDKPGGMRIWLRVLLVVSLALNLLVAGAVGGAFLKHHKWRGHHASRLEMGGPMTRALSPEDRHAIGRKIRETYREGRPDRAEQREIMLGLVEDLKAVPYDPEAVKTRMTRIRAKFGARLEIRQSLLLDHLNAMDDTARAAYADRLREHFSR